MRVVAQVGARTFLVRTRGRTRLGARGRIVELGREPYGELPLDSLMRAGYWEPVTNRRLARRALRAARRAR